MRVPGRLHITWQDDHTLKVETDGAGEQTRLLHFGTWAGTKGAATWQGDSRADWETPPTQTGNNGGARPLRRRNRASLKVATTHIPSRISAQKNGIPYSPNATLTEYWDLAIEKHLSQQFNGEQWVTITDRRLMIHSICRLRGSPACTSKRKQTARSGIRSLVHRDGK